MSSEKLPGAAVCEVLIRVTSPGMQPVTMRGQAEIRDGDSVAAFDALMPGFVAALRERIVRSDGR